MTWSPKQWPLSGRTSGGLFLSTNCGLTFFAPRLLARNRSQFSGACVVESGAVFVWKSDSATMAIVSFSVQRRLGDTLKVGLWEPVARPVSESVCFCFLAVFRFLPWLLFSSNALVIVLPTCFLSVYLHSFSIDQFPTYRDCWLTHSCRLTIID